jgi:hypothetical protein
MLTQVTQTTTLSASRTYFGSIPIILSTLLFLVIGWGCDDETGFNSGGSPDINVSPNPITLTAVPIGQTTSKKITIKNVGEGTLRVIDLYLSSELSSLEFSLTMPEGIDNSFELETGEDIELMLNYSPSNEGLDRGRLVIVNNSLSAVDTQNMTSISIETTIGQSDLIYDTRAVFVLNPCDTNDVHWHEFKNFGVVPVTLQNIVLTDETSSAFSLTNFEILRSGESEPEQVVDVAGVSIRQGDTFKVGITYVPGVEGAAEGTLLVSYAGDNGTPLRVELSGIEFQPLVDISPTAVEFGPHDLGIESPTINVTLTNNGLDALNVDQLELAINDPAINAQFTLHDVQVPQVIEPDASFSFGVSYAPAMAGGHRTAVSISFGECQGQVSIPLSGRLKQPCIQTTPEAVDFRVIAQGQPSAPFLVEVLNCGDAPLDVTEVGLGSQTDGFSWRWVDQNTNVPFILDTRMTQLIEVTYQNTGLQEGARAMDSLVIENSSPDTPVLTVPLSVTGGGSPTCDMQIIPERMNFGLVTRGRSVTRQLRAVNRGTGSCELRSQTIDPLIPIPIPGLGDVFFDLTQPIPGNQAAAAQFLPFEITYSPELFNSDSAVYTLNYFDPFTNQDKMAQANLSGISGESNIEVIPTRLNFGQVTAGDCASREERVTVYNTGLVDLCITGMSLEGPGCSEFLITNRPVADQDGCIVVTRNRPAEVNLVYEPGNLGADECELVFISDAADAPELRVPLEGEGVATSSQVDEFVQTSGQTVDVLFIIDNSGSMSEEQENLSDNFAQFITGAQQFQNDYQIGVVTTDMEDGRESGRLQGSPRIMSRSPDVANQFARTADVGTSGSGTEKGLAAAQSALSDPLIYDTGLACGSDSDCVAPDTCIEGFCGGYNRGFLREEAALELVFVSDEDDFSDANLNFYVDFFKNIKGFRNEGRFHANAIVGANNGSAASCSGAGGDANAGSRYVEVANRTNGQVYSICETDFGRPLQEIGNQAFGLPVQFFLTRPAERNSIQVSVDGGMRNSGWTYDSASNSIIFDEAQVPQPGQRVRVEYNAQCFPRRGD